MAEVTREGANKVLEFVSSGVANLSAMTSRTRTQRPELVKRLNPEIGSQRLVNLVTAWNHEIMEMMAFVYMKNTKIKSLIFGLVACLLTSINNVKAVNNTTAELQKEIYELQKRLEKIENDNNNYDNIKNHILSDVKLKGRLHIELLDSNNEGNAFGLLGGKVAEKRKFNSQMTSLKMGVKKKLSNKSDFVFSLISTTEELKLLEVYFNYRIFPDLTIDIGQVIMPLSLGTENCSNGLPTLEETRYFSVGGLFIDNVIGIKANYHVKQGGIITGIYGNSYSDSIKDVSRFIFNFRGYVNPYKFDNNLMHLGFSYYNSLMDKNPEHKIPTTLSDIANGEDINLKYDIKQVENGNVEFALNHNWFNLQTEYSKGFVTPAKYGYQKRFHISNYYIKTGFILTGETLEYEQGNFERIKVNNPVNENGIGAIELALRFADTRMNDKIDNIYFDYGNYKEYTVALNWLPINFIKLILQYSRIEEEFETPVAQAVNNGNKINKYDVFALKGKIFF